MRANFLIFTSLFLLASCHGLGRKEKSNDIVKTSSRGPNALWPRSCEPLGESIKDTLNKLNSSHYQLDEKETSKLRQTDQTKKKPKFIALVVHGLNLKPSKMKALEDTLMDKGSLVIRVALEGHRGNLEEQKVITWQSWQEQFHDHFCLAQNLSKKYSVPLINLSFSLGSLVSLGHIANQESWPYDKAVFIAPAAWIHWYGNIPAWFNFLGGSIGIPSKNLVEYRSQGTTSLAAYEAMAQGRKLIEEMPAQLLKNPALIVIDPDDELVSIKKIQQFLKEKKIQKHWRLYRVNNRESTLKKSYHHLIIDENSLGKRQWKALQQRLSRFLTGPKIPR